MARFSWQPPDSNALGGAGAHWTSDVPLVRPYVIRMNPEPPPATAPELAAVADCCLAAPTTVLWRVRLESGSAQVAELQLCGHHADAHEPAAHEQGWFAVIDTRQRLRDVARNLA